ncbi:phycobilisome core-membrane linker polypeptide (Lcm) (plastid) [Chondrus crispus]|uniref:Phycobiliprotein ApcE n=1 Tax=Chondrus crispus TaxID=2769 RepID=M5DBU8_CHOCR|nr:phycobilisome core-membrane linker polypeptide (Lcm) [Chondrus crispus]CCP38162.1 phycobilisome core-membrane linker polypeptide (Lcm) [Chondrus crispus]|eukprot:YP_007627415.1 phycobilisome core-membrane linker polypeptide (Lcm) (plastid) [Chondrus crispus]
MIVKASGGSPVARPQLYRTASISTIAQAEQQDRFLQLGELNELVAFLNSGSKRLEVADLLGKNANILVAKAADKIFIGGSAIAYLERPQASFLSSEIKDNTGSLSGNTQNNIFQSVTSVFSTNDSLPPGFKPINIVRYGSVRMKKSLRDLDWFLRYLTYAIVTGDPNILSVNIRGLRELIDNACSSAAATVALREMRQVALTIFTDDIEGQLLVKEYFNVVIKEFDASSLTDKLRKRESGDLQGLRLPQIYAKAGVATQRFVMKTSLSTEEKNTVIHACYRQVFERDIAKAYDLVFFDLESQVKNGQLSVKEFIRLLGKSSIYRKQFFEPFVNSRALELAFKHFLGRGPSSLEEFQRYFSVISSRGLAGLVDSLINSTEYSDYFAEETVPYARSLGEEPQESRNWGAQIDLFNYSTVFRKIPQFITLFSDYKNSLPDQHPYGLSNDPLGIQFGAIFPQNTINLRKKSAPFTKDTRRILIRRGPGIYNQISQPSLRSKLTESLGPKVFKLNNVASKVAVLQDQENVEANLSQVIRATYLRVFGRVIYQEELLNLKRFENQLREGQISVRNFVRLLAKTSIFRSLYWEPLYICKAIEYIHCRLLGRPTYGRQEINKYFNIVYKQSYYKLIDAIIDSTEYIECFADNIVPYERYNTASTVSSRNLRSGISAMQLQVLLPNQKPAKFIDLGSIQEIRSNNCIQQRLLQGVTSKRDQTVIFKVQQSTNKSEIKQILRALYRQIFERDLNSFTLGDEFYNLEKAFLNQEINIQQLIEQLGSSSLYRKEFYQPYPNTKVIELGTKHFLGRAPNNQAEIRYYNQILASQGLSYFISALVNSVEYNAIFGSNIVPYRRFPTLPAANFPNTEKLYNALTKQNEIIVVPSFKAIAGNQ